MGCSEVLAGLVVDEAVFGSVIEGLSTHAPAVQPPAWDAFTDEYRWTLVPDAEGAGYKAEFLVHHSPGATVKVNVWMAPDLRRGEEPMPHGHPWPFTAHLLMGGYTEQRYRLTDGSVDAHTVTHRQGGANHLPVSVFHEVTDVHEPGRTVSLMVCGAGRSGLWGYLDPQTGRVTPPRPDPAFQERLKALNPRLG